MEHCASSFKQQVNGEVTIAVPDQQQEIEQWVFREKVKILFGNFRLSWILSLLVSTLFLHLSLAAGHYAVGIGWWLTAFAVIMARHRLVTVFFRKIDSIPLPDYRIWCRRFTWLTFLTGIVWGAAGLIMGPMLSSVDQVLIFLVLIGLSGGAIPLLGIHKLTLFAYIIPTVVPYMLWVAMALLDKLAIILMINALYMISILVAIARTDEYITESLRLKYTLEQRTEKLQDANEKLEHMILVDALTQLYNRRYFERQLDMEWKKCHRESKRLAMLVIDIDFFKAYNDHYGHLSGDECLKSVAYVLSNSLNRPGDIIARIGGEEFVALLPDSDEAGASTVAETIQHNLRHARIPHAASEVSDFVTVSTGLAVTYPSDRVSALSLFTAADKALYRAKAAGRNRIVVGELEPLES